MVIWLPELCIIPHSIVLTRSTTYPSHHLTLLFYLCLVPLETHDALSQAITFHQLLISVLFSSQAILFTCGGFWPLGHPFLCSLSPLLGHILFPFSSEIVKAQIKQGGGGQKRGRIDSQWVWKDRSAVPRRWSIGSLVLPSGESIGFVINRLVFGDVNDTSNWNKVTISLSVALNII